MRDVVPDTLGRTEATANTRNKIREEHHDRHCQRDGTTQDERKRQLDEIRRILAEAKMAHDISD